jgi:DNA-binding NarL/FixJ family response regulator
VSIRVVLADDHPVVRDGLRAAIEKRSEDIKIVGEAANGPEVLKLAEKEQIDVYILDISMPLLNGIETAIRLIKMDKNSKIIILSIHDSRVFVHKALTSGAKGYIVKESVTEEVIYAIKQVNKGRYFLSPSVSKFMTAEFLTNKSCFNQDRMIRLTLREREVLQLIAEGLTDKEIAKKLIISLHTAHVHRKNIMQKLDIHRNANLVRYAIKEGMVKL